MGNLLFFDLKGEIFMKNTKFIPYEKLSKKAQKELNQKKRSGWGELNPAMKIEKNSKAYKRHEKHRKRGESLYA